MKKQRKIRYAVVGLGYISQIAVLPAFKHASKNSELAALVSDDPLKLKRLARLYDVPATYSYDDYEDCLQSGDIDAVYIALPNSMHCEFSLLAARHGVHVLCEKPMAVVEEECQQMIEAAEDNAVKLMVAYRLHFEKANLKALQIARSKKLGDLRIFNSVFSMQVKKGNSRLRAELGGGSLYDLGIYCLNAARNLFGADPVEVSAFTANNGEQRFKEVDEMTGALLRFPEERIATFVSSFGAADSSYFELIGTRGSLRLDPAYEMVEELEYVLKTGSGKKRGSAPKRDQFGPELLYLSDCILKNAEPEPSGREGLADVRVIEALYRSAQEGHPVRLRPVERERAPRMKQEIHLPAIRRPSLVHAEAPGR